MTDAQPIGPTIEQLLEDVTFANPDPRVQRLKGMWEETKRETEELFQRAKAEQLEERRRYHRICQTPNGEAAAQGEAWALSQLLIEERDERLNTIWQDIYRRVGVVLEEIQQD